MMIKEVDSKIQDFADVENICPGDIAKNELLAYWVKIMRRGYSSTRDKSLGQNTEFVKILNVFPPT